MQKNIHFLTGEELNPEQITSVLQETSKLKKERAEGKLNHALGGKHLALLFDKPSLRTRFSFTIAMRELGGDVVESIADTRKVETPEDQVGVLRGYCHAIMLRTHDDQILERMASASSIPIINGLSNLHHPCQILSDLFTLFEIFGSLRGITLSYIGDGNNILHSLLLMAPMMGINLHYSCPKERGPDHKILMRAHSKLTNNAQGQIHAFAKPAEAVVGAHAIYTDVWTSMGFEDTRAEHLFDGFQVNEALMAHARPEAVFMHCLPMERGKEVSKTLPDRLCSIIFRQSENRLHAQKSLLLHLLKEEID